MAIKCAFLLVIVFLLVSCDSNGSRSRSTATTEPPVENSLEPTLEQGIDETTPLDISDVPGEDDNNDLPAENEPVEVVDENTTNTGSDTDTQEQELTYDQTEQEQNSASAKTSVARYWNEVLLHSIRNDFARPTVHARNLFHTAIAMYDGWAVYDGDAETYMLGKNLAGSYCPLDTFTAPSDIDQARHEAISYAAYRLLIQRFQNTPSGQFYLHYLHDKMRDLGYSTAETSTDYTTGSAAAMGNYLAQCIIDYGLNDGANERNRYRNTVYEPINPPLVLRLPGNPAILDYNRWQPLAFRTFIDQSGNATGNAPEFLSPEWGQVRPFALTESNNLSIYERDGFDYWVYEDPGVPPTLSINGGGDTTASGAYQWGFSMVSIWSSHLDPADGVLWDISPGNIGNVSQLPQSVTEYPAFYRRFEGGDISLGHALNPHTDAPYAPNIVPRGDYTRVLAEFWADGPESETPPGHWFVILNYVSDHPELLKKFQGKGEVLSSLEWDVKSYFALAGAMHDSAVASWGIKGWYDYIRPISAIRAMAALGQSSDSTLENYDPNGIPLVDNYIEIVQEGDPLAGHSNEHAGKIKLFSWIGANALERPSVQTAGVDWILAENWWPYQRPSFVTPPFAGYISGHSTYSRAAAEVLTLLTGDTYFPGGMGEFLAPKNEFLVFEDGPSVDVLLQWATYRDASDQCSLSRIWGGIHPPADDIPGRRIGEVIGINAFEKARQLFLGTQQR